MCDPCCPPCGSSRSCCSHELRCGILYTTCDCIKRNGLQDKCPRAACQGRSACMAFPHPGCCPSAIPLRYASMTMGIRKPRCGCGPCSPCGPCGGCGPCGAYCGPCGW